MSQSHYIVDMGDTRTMTRLDLDRLAVRLADLDRVARSAKMAVFGASAESTALQDRLTLIIAQVELAKRDMHAVRAAEGVAAPTG